MTNHERGNTMTAMGQTIPIGQLMPKTKQRSVGIRERDGTIRGGNFSIPQGDFARFLGWKAPTDKEKSGQKKMSGGRTLEVAIQKQLNELGKGAMQRGMAYRNQYISWGRFSNEPGREKDMIKSGLDAVNESVELGHAMGIRYLEMQYKFQLASKNFGSISNLMKARHESIKKAVNDVR